MTQPHRKHWAVIDSASPAGTPLTAEEEALYREGLRDAPTVTDGLPWSLLQITTAEWADRCRRLLATLDVARSRSAKEDRQTFAAVTWALAYLDGHPTEDALRAARAVLVTLRDSLAAVESDSQLGSQLGSRHA